MLNFIDKVSNNLDDLIESGEERQEQLTKRHDRDMSSDNWLSKSIRPISLIVLLSLQIIIVILSSFGFTPDPTIIGQHGLLLVAAFGFYFNSKKAERIADKNAKANREIFEMKIKKGGKDE